MAEQCQHVLNGKRCRAYAITNSNFCFMHDPKSAVKRAEARKKGGYNRRKTRSPEFEYHPIQSVEDINEVLESSINEARSMETSQSKLRVIAYLCQIALKGQELGNIEERVGYIENRIEKMEDGNEFKS